MRGARAERAAARVAARAVAAARLAAVDGLAVMRASLTVGLVVVLAAGGALRPRAHEVARRHVLRIRVPGDELVEDASVAVQLQEIAVHTYDAQVTLGAPQPLPDEAALDGVEEFQFTCCATTVAWPHEPAVVDYHATEGRSWRLWLSGDGARIARLSAPGTLPATAAGEDPDAADASARGTASELVLAFYGRIPVDSLELDGDRRIFDQLIAWDPDA